MDLDKDPDKVAFFLLEKASSQLPAGLPFLIALQVPDASQPSGVATHMVTNMSPEFAQEALRDLLGRFEHQQFVLLVEGGTSEHH